MIRLLICDDHAIVREGLKQILADASDLEVAAEAGDGPETVAQVCAAESTSCCSTSPCRGATGWTC
jgi:DNA-binding NarL/FixJ family response regulator